MEENIHDDKLDDYVRKSFEGHEEDPSSDMWSRVEADLLPPTIIPAPRATYLRYGWQAVAAVVILVLFSTLVCEHLYYQEKLRALTVSQTVEQNPGSKSNETAEVKSPINPPNQSFQTIEVAPTKTTAGAIPPVLNEIRTQTPALTLKKELSVSKDKTPNIHTTIPEQKEERWGVSSAKTLHSKEQGAETSKPAIATGIEIAAQPSTQSIDLTSAYAPDVPKNLELTCLPTELSLLDRPALMARTRTLIPIQPVREASGWYVGVQTSLLAKRERGRIPIARLGRPAFTSKQENTSAIAIWWLKAGKKLNTRVSLESGLGYQKTVQEAIHTPGFRFGDGIQQGLGTRRAYNYDLTTYGGTAEVSLRMELTNPGTQPSDSEPISLRINTRQRIEMLRIPLLAKYQFGTKRLQANAKIGLMGNITLKNEMNISARVSQNSRFQPVAGSDGYTLQLNQKKFFLGYWLSVGAEFKMNKHLSLFFEPTLVGDFTRKDQYDRRLPQQFLSGLNVGANFYF